MKPHGNTGRRNAAKPAHLRKTINRTLRLTPAEIADHDAQRGKMPWSKWARLQLGAIAVTPNFSHR